MKPLLHEINPDGKYFVANKEGTFRSEDFAGYEEAKIELKKIQQIHPDARLHWFVLL